MTNLRKELNSESLELMAAILDKVTNLSTVTYVDPRGHEGAVSVTAVRIATWDEKAVLLLTARDTYVWNALAVAIPLFNTKFGET